LVAVTANDKNFPPRELATLIALRDSFRIAVQRVGLLVVAAVTAEVQEYQARVSPGRGDPRQTPSVADNSSPRIGEPTIKGLTVVEGFTFTSGVDRDHTATTPDEFVPVTCATKYLPTSVARVV
jgi:hypothetical protein